MNPQSLYLANDDRKKWYASTFQNAQSEEAIYAVFAQYCHDLGGAIDGGNAIALNAKRQGALELVQRIASFTIPQKPVKHTSLDSPLQDTTIRGGPTFPVSKPKTQ